MSNSKVFHFFDRPQLLLTLDATGFSHLFQVNGGTSVATRRRQLSRAIPCASASNYTRNTIRLVGLQFSQSFRH